MQSKLIGLIAMLALATLRSWARPRFWRTVLVATLSIPLPGVMPDARAQLNYPAFTEVVNVSSNPGNSNYPQIASKNDKLFTVWTDGADVLYRRLNIVDGKVNPDPTVNITRFDPNVNAAVSPQIATDPLGGDDNVYVAWTQVRDGRIWFKRSTDGGQTFGSAVVISKNSDTTTFAPRIAVAGKYVFIAWGDFTDTGFPLDHLPGCPGGGDANFDLAECRFSIYIAASQDGGATFASPVNVSVWPRANGVPGIAAVPNGQSATVYVTWPGISLEGSSTSIFFASSEDSGASWKYAHRCSGDPGILSCNDGFATHPQVAGSANGDIYVAWSERSFTAQDGDNDVVIVVGRDRGASWETAFNLSHTPGTSDYPELAISNSGVQVVWHDGATGVMDVWHSRSIDGGKDFSERRNIGLTQHGFVYRPRIAASGDNVHIVWSDGFDVDYALSTDNGDFFDLFFLSTHHSDQNALHPRLAPNGSFVAAAWDQGGSEPLFDPLPRGERDIYVGATVVNRTDLAISSLEAVQAPYSGKALAKGKPTLVHIEVTNDSPRKVRTNLKLVYETLLNGVMTTVTDIGPVDLRPGVNKFFLPSDSFIFPDGTAFHALATVDPDGNVEDIDETNNTQSISVPIKDTGSLRVLYVPLSLYSDGHDAPTCGQVQRVMETADMDIKAMYPIDPRRLKSEALCTVVFRGASTPPPLDAPKLQLLLYNLEGWAKLGMADIVIGVVPEGWFAANAAGSYAAGAVGLGTQGRHASIVEARLPDSAAWTTAHELAHNLGWVTPGFELEDPDHPSHLKGLLVDGYWVTQRREVKGVENMFWAEAPLNKWIIAESYDYLMSALIKLNERVDPKVILIRGAVAKDNTTTLDPWYRTESLVDVPLGNAGDLTVTYFDGAGQPLGETGFDLPSGLMPDAGATVDTISFSRLIPDVPGARKIVLKKGNLVLAERSATPSSPTVRVLSPNGGERFNPGDTVRVTWESADADGDALTHAVLFSRDAGQTWYPLVLDLQGNEFSFTADATDATQDARIKVIVTDGFNGAEDSSDSGFSIGGASHGLTFGPTEIVRDNVSTYPIMATARTATSGDNVYAVWSERTCQGCSRAGVFFGHSTDSGTSFEPLIELSTNANPNETPFMAVSGNNVYVVWHEDIGHIAMRRSTDGGATFAPMVTLTTNGEFPQIAASGDRVYVVWETSLPTSAPYPPTFQQFDVLFRASVDGGASFAPAQNLSDTGTRDSRRPQVVAAGSNVYVAWHEGNLGDNTALGNVEIRVRRSIDGGVTFDPAVNLGGNALLGTYGPGTTAYEIVDAVRLAAAGNELYVAWRDYTDFKAAIDFTRSVDAGATFAPVVALSSPSRSPWFTQLAVSAGRVYVTWSEGTDANDQGIGTTDVLFRASGDGGATFGPQSILSTGQGRALFPHLVAESNSVNLVWQHDVPSTGLPWEVVFRQSADGGQSFAPAVILGTEQGQVGYPQLAVTPGGNVYATWLGAYGYPTNSRDYRYVAFTAGTVGVGGENRAPTADAGPDRTVTEGSVVALTGLGADLDGDKLAFSWQQTGGPAVTLADADTATASFTAPVGSAGSTLTFQFVVDDGKLESAPSEIKITVTNRPPITNLATQAPWLVERNKWEDRWELPTPIVVGRTAPTDTTPPVTTATLAGTLGSNGWYKAGQPVRLTLSATDDSSGVASTTYAVNGGATQTYGGPVTFTDGEYTVTYGSVDRAGNVETSKSVSFKVDQTAPSFTACALNPAELWPPNHKMVDVTASVTVADSGSGSAGFVLVSATSSEPDNGLGDGDTANDIQDFEIGKPDTQGQLRAERSGLGSGRVYTLTYKASDAAGNAQTCTATATVPHDQGPTTRAQSVRPQVQIGPSARPPAPTAASTQGSPSKNVVAPIVFQAAGPIGPSIQGTIDAFRSALGRNNDNEAGPLPIGRREIDWDDGGDNQTTAIAGNPFAGFAVSRGAIFTTPDGTGFVQAPAAADPVWFPPGGLAGLFEDPTYATLLRTFSPPRLFGAIGSNVVEVDFVVPGGVDAAATIRGFGAVFTGDIGERDGDTLIEYFGADGTLLFSGTVAPSPGDWGLSFFGVVFDDARIAWVRITSSDAVSTPDDGGRRIVVMDDLIYGEPQPLR